MEITRHFTKTLLDRLTNWPKLIQFVIGPRQVGKTTGVKKIFDQWSGFKHYGSADSPIPPSSEWIVQQWNIARGSGRDCLLVLDEIQKIDRWADTVKLLFDEDRAAAKIKVVLLGSANLSLATGMHESLTGRYESIHVPHWTALESKQGFGWDLATFLKFGGYPGAAGLISDVTRWQHFMLHSVLDPIINKDIPGLREIRNPALFRQVLELALSCPAQEISYQKFVGQLQSPGNVNTVANYLRILEQGFLLKCLEKYSTRKLTAKTSSPKIIPLCPALINSISDPHKLDRDPAWNGRVLEAAVGAKLLSSRGKLTYWREGSVEVDFVLERGDQVLAIEVKSNSKKPLKGLSAFTKNFSDAQVLTLDLRLSEGLLFSSDTDMFIDQCLGGNVR